MSTMYVEQIGVTGPGLAGWEASAPVLRGDAPYAHQALGKLSAELLPANERRRTTNTIRMALCAAQDAIASSNTPAEELATVFASSDGDLEIVDRICTALDTVERPVSPFHFHNSVHNAPAGYWAIATQSRRPSTSLSVYDATFAAGLLEAMTMVRAEQCPVLLVAYDFPPPPPLHTARLIGEPFAVALLLHHEATPASTTRLDIAMADDQGNEDRMQDTTLENLRTVNPAARALPLIMAIAREEAATVRLPYLPGSLLHIECTPCR
ncbi:MAG: beta-ketoacyl synthase chain length factor [Pseudomonadota bacterium]|nr:MAG: beta-ketoacyl synthase chain length factor [Pseudomonadota bacterium]